MIQAERELVEDAIAHSKKTLWVKFRYAYHKDSARHMVYCAVNMQIFNDDRVDPISFQQWLEKLYSHETSQLDCSCEEIANNLYLQIWQRYPHRNVWIEISKDNETGYTLEYLV